MTLVLNDRRARYVASADQTSFDVDFPIDTDADVAVYHKVALTGVITLLTLTTDYTVTLDGAAPNTADVDLVVGAAVNDIITVEGETDPDRDTDFTTGGDFFAGTVNNAEDRQYRIDQETKRDRDRTVVANRVSPDTFDPTLPDIVGEALKTVRINAAETAFEFTEPTGQGPQGETGATGADGDMTNPMTARGDMITGDAAGPGDPQRIAVGAANKYWKSDGTDPSWEDVAIVDDPTPQFGADVDGQDKTLSEVNLKDYGEITVVKGNLGATPAFDISAGNHQTGTADQEVTSSSFTNPTASDELCSWNLSLTNGGAAAFAWPASVDWAGGSAPSLTAAGIDFLVFWTYDGGTIWHGAIASTDSS